MKYIIMIFSLTVLYTVGQPPYPYTPLGGLYSGTYLTGTSTFEGNNVIASQLFVENAAQYDLKASESIHITSNSHMSNFSVNGFFHAHIDPSILNIASFNVSGWSNIGRFDRFEIGVQLPPTVDQQVENFLQGSAGINPYDFSQILVEADFILMGSGGAIASYHRDGFYYRDITITNNSGYINNFNPTKSAYPFRIRFSPPLNGNYLVNITLKVSGNTVAHFNQAQFNVIETGKLGKLSFGNHRHLKDAHGNSFMALGENIAYAEGYPEPNHNDFEEQRNHVINLANNGGNFFRIRMDPWSNELELEELEVYGSNRTGALNFKRQWHAYELDKTFETAENNNMYMFFTLLQDQQYNVISNPPYEATNTPFHWYQSPYKNFAGLSNPQDFFNISNSAFIYYKNKLRYFMARYGYSSNLAILSLVNETDNIGTYKTTAQTRSHIWQWLNNVGNYLKTFYPMPLTTTGYADGPSNPDFGTGSNPYFDMVSVNDYSSSRRVLKQRHDTKPTNVLAGNNNGQSFIYGEMGCGLCNPDHPDKYTDADFHNNLWATAMFHNSIGTGLYWWDWHDQYLNHRANFNGLKAFFVTQSPPDFENNDFTSDWDCDVSAIGLLKNRKIEWINNVTPDGKRGFGWVHNSDYFWINDPNALSGLSNSYSSNCYNEGGGPLAEPTGPYNIPSHNELIDLKNYESGAGFQVDIYTCYNNYGFDNSFVKNSTAFGHIKFKRLIGRHPLDLSDGQPDFAYKIHRGNISFRTTNELEPDTELVYAESPCIKTYGYLDYAKKGTHKWQLDDGSYILEESPELCFPKQKQYLVKHFFEDTLGINCVISQPVLINYKKDPDEFINVNYSRCKVFPNPTSAGFKVESFSTIKSISILNNLGEILSTYGNINKTTFNCEAFQNFTHGSYLIHIIFYDNTETFLKIIKI